MNNRFPAVDREVLDTVAKWEGRDKDHICTQTDGRTDVEVNESLAQLCKSGFVKTEHEDSTTFVTSYYLTERGRDNVAE